MKKIILIIGGLFSCFLVSAQIVDKEFTLLEGDTYSVKMLKGWLPPTSAKEYGEPFRRKGKYETTTFLRVNPKRKDRCGASVEITEIKGCRNYLDVFQRDSIRLASNERVIKVRYEPISGGNIKRMTVLVYKADRHPETNELSALQQVNWYVQGSANTYYISFSSCTMLLELLPRIKMIVASLKEK